MKFYLSLLLFFSTHLHADINKQLIENDLSKEIKEPIDNCSTSVDCKLIHAKCGVSLAVNASVEDKVRQVIDKDVLKICHDFVANNSPFGVRCEGKKCVLIWDGPKNSENKK